MTSWMARLISSSMGAWWDLRSRNGIFICIFCCEFIQDPSGIAGYNCIRRYALGYDTSGAHNGVFSNGDSSQQSGSRADRGPTLNHSVLAMPIRLDLGLPSSSGRPRVAVVDESNTVTDEHF